MANPLLNIAIIDMYDGNTNVGMECIVSILKKWSVKRNLPISYSIFKLREAGEIPNENFDIYLSSGGPGSPLDSKDAPWDKMYTRWLDQMMALSKPVFLICHSFQIACRHFNLGTITLRKSRQIGILPIHPLTEDVIFNGLADPFYALESREYQIIAPNDEALAKMGGSIIALEKIRPQVPLERAIMAIRFNKYMIGVQFHPEGETEALQGFFQEQVLKNKIIDEFGIEKWETIIAQLEDPNKIQKTASTFIPNFLDRAMQIPLN